MNGFSVSGYFAVQPANAQTSGCANDPTPASVGEGRIYYNSACKQFRMSRGDINSGAWEEVGGGVWKYYASAVSPFITSNDIYNANVASGSGASFDPAIVFVNTMSVFGVSDWGNGTTAATVVELPGPTDNLIYGAASFSSDTSASLLKLERWVGATTYEPVFNVRMDGVVEVGANGTLITPRLCLPNDTVAENCITGWSDLTGGGDPGTSGAAASDLWWTQSDPSTQGEITNRNYLDATDKTLGGNVKLTNTLYVQGQVSIQKNLSNNASWSTLGIPTTSTGANVNDVWYDMIASFYTAGYIDDSDYPGESGYGSIALAVTESGKIITIRSEGHSTTIPLLDSDTNGLVFTSDVTDGNATAKPLRGVCTIGDGDASSANRSRYQIIAVGDDGEIWKYGDLTGAADGNAAGDWGWIRLTVPAVAAGHVNTTPDFYDVWCKGTAGNADNAVTTYDVYAVGEFGAIARYSGGTGYSWVRQPCGPGDTASDCGGGQRPTLRAIWSTMQTVDYVARYYAAGDSTGSVNNVLYWEQVPGAPAIQSVQLSTNKAFYAVKGYNGLCENCAAGGKKVYVAGEGGVMYSTPHTTGVPSFTQIMNGASSSWDITKLLVNYKIVFATMKSKNPSATNQSVAVKYAPVSGFGSLNQPEFWLDAPFTNNNKYLGIDMLSMDGMARTKVAASTHTYDRETFRIYGVGGSKSLVIGANPVYFLHSQESPTSWTSNIAGAYDSVAQWSEKNYGSGVNLYAAWQPTNLTSDTNVYSFVGGDSGVIWKGRWEYTPILGYDAGGINTKMTTRGIAGYPRVQSGYYIPYEVFAVATRQETDIRYSGYILRFNQDSTAPGFTKVKEFVTTADSQYYGLNAVWAASTGLVVAVGQGGTIRWCTANCEQQSSTWSVRTPIGPGAGNLTGISGKADGSVFFVTDSNGYIWRCNSSIVCTSTFIGEPLNAVWVRDRGATATAWAVGEAGLAYYNGAVTGNSWMDLTLSDYIPDVTSMNLTSVGGAADKVFFGGSGGRIVYSRNGSANWRIDSVGPSGSVINALAGTEWNTALYGVVWGVGSNSLGREYIIGGAALSGDLKAEFNRWGEKEWRVELPGVGGYKDCATGNTSGEGMFVTGLYYDGTGKVVGFKCRSL